MFRLESASKRCEGPTFAVPALSPTTLDIEAGEFVAVVGDRDSGHTTMLLLLAGMLAPTAGKVWFEGRSLYDLSAADRLDLRRRKIGFLSRHVDLLPNLSAQENVEVEMLHLGVPESARRQRSGELLDRFGLADKAIFKPRHLSHGQRQRIALARVLAGQPRAVLANDPTRNLVPKSRKLLLSYFDELRREGKTIVIATQDPQVGERATRILQLIDGTIVSQTRPGVPHVA